MTIKRKIKPVRGAMTGLMLSLCSFTAFAGELADLLRGTLTHPALAARTEQTQAARHELDAATSRYFGSGGLTAETSRYEDQRFVGVLTPSALANPPFARNVSRYGGYYSLPIDLFGAIAASRRAAKQNLAAAELLQRQTVLLQLHDATSSYVRLQSLQHQAEVLRVQRERVQQTVERVAREVQIEKAAAVDLRLAESELARLKSDDLRLNGAIEEAQAVLKEATGSLPITLQATTLTPPSWPAEKVDQALPVSLAETRAEATAAQAKEASRALWPSVSAVVDYFQFDGGGATPDTWSLSARISVPLDPAGWKRASAAQAAAEGTLWEREAARRAVKRQWAALRSAYESAKADSEALQQEIAAREEVVKVQSELQRVGMASLEDFLRQQRDLLDAESRLSEARARAVIAWSAAQVLLGLPAEDYIAALDHP